jgi:hypothetical protein
METSSYTVSTKRNFTIDGSEVADVVKKFSDDWVNSPLEIQCLVAEIYVSGVKRGIELGIGQNVTKSIVDKERKVEGGESTRESKE